MVLAQSEAAMTIVDEAIATRRSAMRAAVKPPRCGRADRAKDMMTQEDEGRDLGICTRLDVNRCVV